MRIRIRQSIISTTGIPGILLLFSLSLLSAGCSRISLSLPPSLPNGVASGDVDQTSAVLWTRSTVTGPLTFTYSLVGGIEEQPIVVPVDDPQRPVTVTLDAATGDGVDTTVDQPGVCFEIELSGATATGCVGRGLLATGLAYGAFQDGDGPIELVGIVPDEVTAIEIDGEVITPTNNVWHYTATSSGPLTITVRSADGRAAATM